jgi:hypothetical protein
MPLANSLGGFGGFAEGFVETHLAVQKQQLLRDALIQKEKHDSEHIKLLQQELKGREAGRQLQERKFLADLEAGQQERQLAAQQFQWKVDQARQQQQARQHAGSALGLLHGDAADTLGFHLDDQSRGELQGLVTTQQAREGQIGEAVKQFQQHLQAREVVGGISLEGLPAAQQQLGNAALSAFQQGRLSGDGLFSLLNRFGSAGTSPTRGGRRGTRADLAMQAAEGNAAAAEALRMMSPGERSMTSAELAWRSSGSGPDAERAQQALDQLQRLRTPPRTGRRKDRTIPEPGPADHPTTYRGETFQGRGRSTPEADEDPEALPRIKSFRRVK